MGQSDDTIRTFLSAQRSKLRWIASKTKGEYTLEDIESEVWLIADQINRKRGYSVNYLCPDDQDLILGWLYREIVTFKEKAVRYALRLDKAWEDDEGQAVPLLDFLVSAPTDSDPLVRLLGIQECAETLDLVNGSYSQAAAYVILLYRFDLDIESLADELRIVVGTLRVRIGGSVLHLRLQPSLFDRIQSIDRNFVPTRSRGFARTTYPAAREPGQIAFEFC